MTFIKTFRQLSKKDISIAGGKGASLGEMTKAGIPVPDGFVILAAAFERFIEEMNILPDIDAVLHKLDCNNTNSVEVASEEIQAMIMSKELPADIVSEIKKAFRHLDAKFVAVRSSATSEDSSVAAWAGQLDTFLNTQYMNLLKNVQKCWASLFTPRAIFYRFEKNMHTRKISVAVVVQKMVESEVSGVAFSVHPVTQDRNQMIIEASYGLGEAIVSGQVTPDHYVVEKKGLIILDKMILQKEKGIFKSEKGGNAWKLISPKKRNAPALNDLEILELSKLIIKIENHYGFPCDIEWAKAKGKFHITQSRPITTLLELGERVKELKSEVPVFFQNLDRFATRPMTVQRDEFLGTMWWHLCKGRSCSIPLSEGVRATYVEKSDAERGYKKIVAEEFSSEEKWKNHLKKYKHLIKEMQTISNLAKSAQKKKMSELALIYKGWLKTWNLFGKFIIAPYAIEKIIDLKCRNAVYEEFGADKGNEVFEIISSPSQLNDFQKMRLDIMNGVINNKANYQKLARDYGWYNEYSYVEPLLNENYFENETKKISKKQAKKEKIKILGDIKRNKKAFTHLTKQIKNREIKLLADILHNYTFIRTDRIDQLKRAQAKIRNIFNRTAEELTKHSNESWSGKLVAYCLNKEITDFMLKRKLPDINLVKARMNQEYIYYFENGHPKIIYGLDKINKAKKLIEDSEKNRKEIRGLVAFKGIAKGNVALILKKNDLGKVNDKSVLVAKTTMPDYASAMHKVVAFVTEEGGITSHAAIIARELKKPCIVGTGNCTKLLKDGDLVEVDADKGIVRIIKKAKQ